MSQNPTPNPIQPPAPRRDALLLALIAFVLGIVLAGAWFHHHLRSAAKMSALSPATKELMGQLAAPTTIRYYSLLPNGSADEPLRSFAQRATQLLEALKAASHGKLQVTLIDTPSETNAATASANGIQAFNQDKGEPCYLGLNIASGKSHQTFARLQPEWEPALQFDLARAISSVATANAPVTPLAAGDKPDAETIATVHQLIPDVNSTTPEQADRILHTEYLKQSAELATETEAKIKESQQQVVQAQSSGSQSDVEAARKNLLQVQLEQANKLKKLAAQLQIQLSVFKQLKAEADSTEK